MSRGIPTLPRHMDEHSPGEALTRLVQLTRETLTEESWPATEGELRRLQDRARAPRPRLRWSVVAALGINN